MCHSARAEITPDARTDQAYSLLAQSPMNPVAGSIPLRKSRMRWR